MSRGRDWRTADTLTHSLNEWLPQSQRLCEDSEPVVTLERWFVFGADFRLLVWHAEVDFLFEVYERE